MKYKGEWEKLTNEMGYWVDMDNPYLTYDNKYIESVWWLLSEAHKKELVYKGFTVQPYSPKAKLWIKHTRTQSGCYRDVKDTSTWPSVMFKIVKDNKSSFLFNGEKEISFVKMDYHTLDLTIKYYFVRGKR